jgi:hypothetical protein
VIDLNVQQPFAPSWSPDGRSVAFAGNVGGQFDIYVLDVAGGAVKKITDDTRFDGGPVFTPDGQSLVYSSEVGEFQKLFRLDLANPAGARQLTRGDWSDTDPSFTKDGKTIYFSSDRNGFENIYSLDLGTGEIRQHTNAVTGCFMPASVERADGSQALIYDGFWKGGFNLYRADLDQALPVVETLPDLATQSPTPDAALERYEPDIQVTVNDENKERYRGLKLFLEDGDIGVGVTSDQLVVSQSQLVFSDYLGDRRLFVQFNSVASFSDFNIIYMNLARRLQWGAVIYDNRTFFLGLEDNGELTRRSAFRQTGVEGFILYPFNLYNRAEMSLGYVRREYEFPRFILIPGEPGEPPRLQQTGEIRKDTYPEIGLALVGDTTINMGWGPISGRRWRLDTSYAPDVGGVEEDVLINRDANALTASASLDFRWYKSLTRRTEVAFRFFGGASWGQIPDVYYFGGLDDMRGFNFRQFVGDRAFYTNLELRFPLVEVLALPFIAIQGIRGRVFLDTGGAWFEYDGEKFDWWDEDSNGFPADNPFLRTRGPKAAYGWGFTVNLLGLDLNWDFAKQWRFEGAESRYQTTFWVGTRF